MALRGARRTLVIRRDSAWNVPEPELTLVLDAGIRIAGYTVGNDVSSRSIEGENTLYLPQAKTYERSCALGPCIVPVEDITTPFTIRMEIVRGDRVVFAEETSTDRMKREFDELAGWLRTRSRSPSAQCFSPEPASSPSLRSRWSRATSCASISTASGCSRTRWTRSVAVPRDPPVVPAKVALTARSAGP